MTLVVNLVRAVALQRNSFTADGAILDAIVTSQTRQNVMSQPEQGQNVTYGLINNAQCLCFPCFFA